MDLLFDCRIEEKIAINPNTIWGILRELELKENAQAATGVQNIYFNSPDYAMPLTHSVRARAYGMPGHTLPITEGPYFIDSTSAEFNRRTKERTAGTLRDATAALDAKYSVRRGPFKPFFCMDYDRRVFDSEGVRVTVDMNLRGSDLNERVRSQPLSMPPAAQVEVKYVDEQAGSPIVAALKNAGGVPTVSKHAMLDNAQLSLLNPVFKQLVFPESLVGKEWETKFDVSGDAQYKQFVFDVWDGKVPGFKAWEAHPHLMMYITFNEYRRLPDSHLMARLTHRGFETPRLIVKDRGVFVEGNVLLRDERLVEIDERMKDSLARAPVVGALKRSKRLFVVESETTGNAYYITADLVEAPKGHMYQIEAEYAGSRRVAPKDPEQEILNELGILGDILADYPDVRPSRLRKEDWVAQNISSEKVSRSGASTGKV